MKLAIVNNNLGSGGAEKLIYDMSLELKGKNIDFSVILLTSVDCVYGQKLIEKGIEVIYLSDKWEIYNLKNVLKLARILKEYDVIHTHVYASQLWTAFVSLFLGKGKKYITTEHNVSNRRRGKIYFKYLDKWMYSRYTTIVSITKNVQKELQNWIKLETNYKIIKNGINLERYINAISKNRHEFNLKNSDKLICQVARFDEVKTHETTIEALKLLSENYKVIFLGEGDTKEKIRDMVKKYNLDKRVLFLGYRFDVPEIIKMSDISILTSKYEGLPISAIEAMCSNPFVGSNTPGIKELVKNYGELFEYKNFRELSKLLEEILENENQYLKLKEKCRLKALEFDIENTVLEYIKIYEEEKNGL